MCGVCCPTSPKCVSRCLLKIAFGGALALFGLAHYLDMQGFVAMVTGGFTGVLFALAKLWAYILPALMIIGGALLIANYRLDVAAWCAGIALASIAIGMPLKAVLGTTGLTVEIGQAVNNALLWLLIYVFVVKCSGCAHKGGEGGMGGGGHSCSTC